MRISVRYFIAGQVSFFLFLVICLMIRPLGWYADHGISYYGVWRNTLPFYVLAFGLSALFTGLSAWQLPKTSKEVRTLRIALLAMVPLLLGLVVTPYTVLDSVHTFFGTLLFVLQLVVGLWLAFEVVPNDTNQVLVILQFFGGVVSALAMISVTTWLLQGQIVFQLMFGVLLARALGELVKR